MFYGYYGGAYFERNYGFLAATPTSSCDGVSGFTCVGFGFPGRRTLEPAVEEDTIGVIPTLWSNANYGRLQAITQYSYLVRTPWSNISTPGNPKNAHTNMVYIGLRYILPDCEHERMKPIADFDNFKREAKRTGSGGKVRGSRRPHRRIEPRSTSGRAAS